MVTVGDNIFTIGGWRLRDAMERVSPAVAVYSFSPNGTLQVNMTDLEDPISCPSCQGYLLPDNKTIVALGLELEDESGVDPENGESPRYVLGVGTFDTISRVWEPLDNTINPLLPTKREYYSSAISPRGDALYLIGGTSDAIETPTGIIRYDLNNRTSIVDLSIAHPSLNLTLMGASAEINGVVVLAFGAYNSEILRNSSEVLLFDTNSNEIRVQPVNGVAPKPRDAPSSTLGPDKSTIYYFGGRDLENAIKTYAGEVYNDIVALDTNTWSWVPLKVTGVAPAPVVNAGMTVFDSDKIFISTGKAFNFYSRSVSVLRNVPGPGESIESSNLQWFTNNDAYDNPHENKELSDGAIAGIVVGVFIFIVIILYLLWKFVPATRRIAAYIQNDMIWNPRSGEPLWAETSRLLVRFILLVLFLAFVAYVIYRSIDSPVVAQEILEDTNSVSIPDIRFCFDGFNEENFKPYVSCVFRNGTTCSDKIIELDNNKHKPTYHDYFGDITCSMFSPGPDFRIVDDKLGYTDATGTKVQFSFSAEPLNLTDISYGVIYIDFYPDGYNPNTIVQGLTTESKLTDDYIRKWKLDEQASNTVNSILLRQGVVSTASYTLSTVSKLRKDDGWNYIGFSSSYSDTMEVQTFYKDSPQSPMNIPAPDDFNRSYISLLVVQPSAFVLTTKKDQKVFTLLNAFAQAGGVLGLFIAVQTILFGFRPQSPWGIVHRWSFGKLRIKLTDRLANYFNRLGTPVPLVNPVNTRFSNVNGQAYFNTGNDMYVPYGPDIPSAVEGSAEQENRMQRMEERLQLMELLLKSYYLNDEVFRSLDQAVKRGHEVRRRSAHDLNKENDTDSGLRNDNGFSSHFEDIPGNGTSDFPMRPRPYQPNVIAQAPLEVYDEEHTMGGK
ncbi:hypothetical protein BD770DRAFT_442325 [Pilaira anomala]|nr:hypothetical protein BD770DRAFT_442325 [Pilaira anomala]